MTKTNQIKQKYERLQSSFKPYFDLFLKSCEHPQEAQEGLLLEMIKANRDSKFGREHNFKDIHSVAEFQARVPIRDYEDFAPYINQMLKGERNILTSEEVINLQPTSGSVSGTKLIPFTDTLRGQFQRGVFTWLYDLFENHPKIKTGKFYWSITPSHRKEIQSVIPIGFGNDLDYFNPEHSQDLCDLSAVPFDIAKDLTFEECKKRTLEHLCSSPDLSFISVWNPTFLSGLVNGVDANNLWKNLSMISCWTDGNSALYLERIKELFPNVDIQGKGLMSTESISSVPLKRFEHPILAVNSHFFEFRNSSGLFLPQDVEDGKSYELITTTGGGFYRYATGDIIEVVDKNKGCPSIRFLGRGNNCSDYVGEKLNELHVSEVLKKSMKKYNVPAMFMMVSPEQEDGVRYYLHLQTSSGGVPNGLLECVELGLRENFHYDYARNTGQVKPLKINILSQHPEQTYLVEEERSGKRAGSIKQTYLSKRLGWKEILK